MPRPTAAQLAAALTAKGKNPAEYNLDGMLTDDASLAALGFPPEKPYEYFSGANPLFDAPPPVRRAARGISDYITTPTLPREQKMEEILGLSVPPGQRGIGLQSPGLGPQLGAELGGFIGGAIEGAAETFNPFDLITTLVPAGRVSKLLNAVLTGRGVSNLAEGYQTGDTREMVQGGLETLFGGVGTRRALKSGTTAQIAPAGSTSQAAANALANLPENPTPEMIHKALEEARRVEAGAAMRKALEDAQARGATPEELQALADAQAPQGPTASKAVTRDDLRAEELRLKQTRREAVAERLRMSKEKAAADAAAKARAESQAAADKAQAAADKAARAQASEKAAAERVAAKAKADAEKAFAAENAAAEKAAREKVKADAKAAAASGAPMIGGLPVPPGVDLPPLAPAANAAEAAVERAFPLSGRMSGPDRLKPRGLDTIESLTGQQTMIDPSRMLGTGGDPNAIPLGASSLAPAPPGPLPDPSGGRLVPAVELGRGTMRGPKGQMQRRTIYGSEGAEAPGAPGAPATTVPTPPPLIKNPDTGLMQMKIDGITVTLAKGSRMQPEEFAGILKRRTKLYADAKGRQLPDDIVAEMDRNGFEYERTKKEFYRMQHTPGADPRLVAQHKQAFHELGERLHQRKVEILQDAARDANGHVDPSLALMLGRVAPMLVTGSVGYAIGDDDEDRLANAMLFAAMPAFGTKGMSPAAMAAFTKTAIPRVANALRTAATKGGMKNLAQDYQYFSMLARPAPIIRASMGAISGAAHASMIRVAQGDIKNAKKIIEALMNDSEKVYYDSLKKGAASARIAPGQRSTGGIWGAPLRLISAADDVGVHAMMKGGFTMDEARRLTLGGKPFSKAGQDFTRVMGKHFLGQLFEPFARVGWNAAEAPFLPFMDKGMKMSEKKARLAITAGIGGAAYAYGGDIDPRKRPYWVAAAGPNSVAAALGLAAAWARENDKSQLNAFLKEGVNQLPLFGSGDLAGARNILTGQRFIPGVLGDIARVMDPSPTGRDREAQPDESAFDKFFASTRAKIPGWRETLPERELPLDIFGRELEDQRPPTSTLGKILMSDPYMGELPTRYPHGNPVADEFRRLGLEARPPQGTIIEDGKPLPLPPETKSWIQQTKGAEMERLLTALMNSPDYRQLGREGQAEMFDAVRDLVNQEMSDDVREVVLQAYAAQLARQQAQGSAGAQAGAGSAR